MQMRLPPVVHPSFGQIASMMGIIWGAACPTAAGTKHKKRQQVNIEVAVNIFLESCHSPCIPRTKESQSNQSEEELILHMNDFYYLHPSSSQCTSSISNTESVAMIIREDVCGMRQTEYLTLPSLLWIELTWQAWVCLFPVLRVVVDKHAFRHSQRGLINGWRVVHRQLQGVQKTLRVLLLSEVQLIEVPPSWVWPSKVC